MQSDNKKFKVEFKSRIYNWVLKTIKIIDNLPKDFVSQTMGKQLLRSSTSVLANYIEAKSASSKKDFINFFTHSLKSANESGVWLTLLRDTNKFTIGDFELLNKERQEVANIIASSIITMKEKS
jgi:four helix bundle protein